MEFPSLPVYNKARDLYGQLQKSTQKVPKEIRVNQIAVIENMIIDVMEKIAFANDAFDNPDERHQFILDSVKCMRRIQIKVRILFDLGLIKKKGFDAIIKLEDNVVRQLNGWAKNNK